MRISLSSAEKIKLYLSSTQKDVPSATGAKASEIARLRKEYDTLDLQKLGISDDTVTASRKALIEGIIRPRLIELFTLIHQNLKEAQVLEKIPAGLVVSGGGAETVSLLEVAKRVMSLPARIGIPKGLKGLVDELHSPSYAAAAGLILYAHKHSNFSALRSSTPAMGSILQKLPLKSAYQSVINFIKSLLP